MDSSAPPTETIPRVAAPTAIVEVRPPVLSGRRRAACDVDEDIFDVGEPLFTCLPMLGEAISQPVTVFEDGSFVRGWFPRG